MARDEAQGRAPVRDAVLRAQLPAVDGHEAGVVLRVVRDVGLQHRQAVAGRGPGRGDRGPRRVGGLGHLAHGVGRRRGRALLEAAVEEAPALQERLRVGQDALHPVDARALASRTGSAGCASRPRRRWAGRRRPAGRRSRPTRPASEFSIGSTPGCGAAVAHLLGDVLEGAGAVQVGVGVQHHGRLGGVGAGGAGVGDPGSVCVAHAGLCGRCGRIRLQRHESPRSLIGAPGAGGRQWRRASAARRGKGEDEAREAGRRHAG